METASEAGDIHLDELDYPTIEELRKYLTEHQGDDALHIMHFDGHGIFAKRCKNKNCKSNIFVSTKMDFGYYNLILTKTNLFNYKVFILKRK